MLVIAWRSHLVNLTAVTAIVACFSAVVLSCGDGQSPSNALQSNSATELRLTHVEGWQLKGIGSNEYTKVFVFDSQNVVDADFTFLSQCTELRELYIVRASITGDALRYIGTLRKLEHLTIKACPIRSSAIAHLKGLVELRQLHLNECSNLDSKDINALLEELELLEVINLDNVPHVTDDTIATLIRLEYLQYVRIHGTGITAEGADRLRKSGIRVDN